jgi:hypothetical protein
VESIDAERNGYKVELGRIDRIRPGAETRNMDSHQRPMHSTEHCYRHEQICGQTEDRGMDWGWLGSDSQVVSDCDEIDRRASS